MKNADRPAQHTSGPWFAVTNAMGTSINSSPTAQKAHIASIATLRFEKEESEANAKLIAAAPEMLEALSLIVKHIPKEVIEDQLGDGYWKVYEAIKKATE